MSVSRLGVQGEPLRRRTKSDIGVQRPKSQYLQFRRNALHPTDSNSCQSSDSELDAAHGPPSKFQLRRLSSAPGLATGRLESGTNQIRSTRQLTGIRASNTKSSKNPNATFAVHDIAEEEEDTEGQRADSNNNMSSMEDGPTIVLNDAEEAVVTAGADVTGGPQNEECRKVSFGHTPEDCKSNPKQTKSPPPDSTNNNNNSISMDSAGETKNLRIKSPSEDRRRSTSTEITMEQREAFREVFDLFDRTGGGTFDAEELDEALRSVNICLDKDELVDVIYGLDKDGNGEIDFDEFLALMTNTERFLESLADEHQGVDGGSSQILEERRQRKEREGLLFQALTQFMKKSAIIGIGEIVGYFRTKYNKAPHVVQHYAAGARLIGLTEKQLHMRLEDLHASSKEQDSASPYAQPLNYKFWWPTLEKKRKKTKEKRSHRRIHLVKFIKDENHHNGQGRKELAQTKSLSDRRRGKVGWQSPRVRHTELKLPMMALVKQQEDKLKRDQHLTFDDLPLLRKNVTNATKSYYNMLWYARTKESKRHWEILDTNSIQSKVLRDQFAKTYEIYSSPEYSRLTTGISTHHMSTHRRRGDSRAWSEDTESERKASSIVYASRRDSNFLGTSRERALKPKGSTASSETANLPPVTEDRRLSEGVDGGSGRSAGTSESRRKSSDMSGGSRLSGTTPGTDRRLSAVRKETGGILPTLAEDR
ncbi:uncharacterized protein LOC118405381 [Branchiostoma floridae]|uniref:Uncharacterized protein LOC118405381 n=1 Tax=Branchiostoma floridae TaxID=7739 RepID=A0A9J7KI73_BRAFL|nr:uncharacterized protein LOC118405381 [Branchiostoma floridae]